MKELGKDFLFKAFGESLTALSEGFNGGDEDCLNWMTYNLQKHHERNTPDNMKYMVGIKTAQQSAMIKSGYLKYKEEMAAKADSEEPDVLKTILDNCVTKEDMAKVMMGRTHELNHVPPKVYDIFRQLRDKFKGSSLRMAEKLADEISNLLSNEGLEDLIHEGFDPIVSSEEYTTKFGKELIEKILGGDRDQTYE